MYQENLMLAQPAAWTRHVGKNPKTTINAADLFCGGGGTSTGLIKAAARLGRHIELLAINHNPEAISTHSLNHPKVRHLCESLDNLDPRKLVKRLNILTASPECTNFSQAKAGKPRDDQSRATAWHVLRWADAVSIDTIMIENVKELMGWGPLNRYGNPIKRLAGTLFKNFINSLKALNYGVEYRVVNCADYGDPTSRERLIILCKKGGKPTWPTQTHADPKLAQDELPHWRQAQEIIDWNLKSQSIFKRKRPLKANTMARILHGLKKFKNGTPFLIQYRGTDETHIRGSAIPITRPLPTVTAGGFHFGLIQPFLIHTTHRGAHRCHGLTQPIPTITGANRGEMALIEPQLKSLDNYCDLQNIEPSFENNRCFLRDKNNRIVGELEVYQRMLQPAELAAGMSFPKEYIFTGTKEEKVRMIGNAVPIETAAAMTESLLRASSQRKN